MIKDILIYPNPILIQKHIEIPPRDKLGEIKQDLWDTLIYHQGLGLAAPQVGLSYRCFIFKGIFAINPKIISTSSSTSVEEEGCLSIPGRRFIVERSSFIKVEYSTLGKDKIISKLAGEEARVFAHELDHLDGILILDRGKEIIV